jgi:hypothetical protein
MDIMGSDRPKIFVSYTIRDGKIDSSFLNRLFNETCGISCVYIDLIHNDSSNKQKRVISELYSSDFIFLIRTEQIESSKWVKKEISLARIFNIPIIEFEYEELIIKNLQPITQVLKNLTLRAKAINS